MSLIIVLKQIDMLVPEILAVVANVKNRFGTQNFRVAAMSSLVDVYRPTHAPLACIILFRVEVLRYSTGLES